MKIIKKVGFILVIVLLIVIYITNKDTKVYYVSLGDGISRGINENDIEGYGYSDYVKDYLNKNNLKLCKEYGKNPNNFFYFFSKGIKGRFEFFETKTMENE